MVRIRRGKNIDGDKNKNVHEEEKGKKREDQDRYVVEEDRKLWDVGPICIFRLANFWWSKRNDK